MKGKLKVFEMDTSFYKELIGRKAISRSNDERHGKYQPEPGLI